MFNDFESNKLMLNFINMIEKELDLIGFQLSDFYRITHESSFHHKRQLSYITFDFFL
jgi:hypothetical protein